MDISTKMPNYRFYLIRSDDGAARLPIIVECKNDDEALNRAQEYAAHNTIEVWESDRWVGQVERADAGTTKHSP